jgi:hypothetical protein
LGIKPFRSLGTFRSGVLERFFFHVGTLFFFILERFFAPISGRFEFRSGVLERFFFPVGTLFWVPFRCSGTLFCHVNFIVVFAFVVESCWFILGFCVYFSVFVVVCVVCCVLLLFALFLLVIYIVLLSSTVFENL